MEETTEQRAAEVEGLLGALRAFAQRGPSTAMAVEDVICCVDSYSYLRFPTDARREMQVLASDALFSLGRDAVQPVIDAVLRSPATRLRWGGAPFITGNEPDTREWLDLESGAYVLKRIGAPAVVPLAALLGDERTCAWAARTLCYLSRDVDIGPALHAVRANLRADAPLDVVLTSLWLVGFFSDDDVAFLLRDITPLVWAGRPRLQEATVQTLAGLGAKAASAQFVLESLHRSLSAEEGAIRAEVERAMVAIGARG